MALHRARHPNVAVAEQIRDVVYVGSDGLGTSAIRWFNKDERPELGADLERSNPSSATLGSGPTTAPLSVGPLIPGNATRSDGSDDAVAVFGPVSPKLPHGA